MANLQTAQHAGSRQSVIHLPSYISGYFDGEGCFSVAMSPRSKLKVGWEVRPSVSVSQNADRAEMIATIHDYFSCGAVRPDPSDATVKWESRSLIDLIERVLPHFRMVPLQSGKRRDVESLDAICQAMARGQHLDSDGLADIVRRVRTMNPSGTRRYEPDEILMDLATR